MTSTTKARSEIFAPDVEGDIFGGIFDELYVEESQAVRYEIPSELSRFATPLSRQEVAAKGEEVLHHWLRFTFISTEEKIRDFSSAATTLPCETGDTPSQFFVPDVPERQDYVDAYNKNLAIRHISALRSLGKEVGVGQAENYVATLNAQEILDIIGDLVEFDSEGNQIVDDEELPGFKDDAHEATINSLVAAKACGECPLKARCLAASMIDARDETEVEQGVWGGLDYRERLRVYRAFDRSKKWIYSKDKARPITIEQYEDAFAKAHALEV